MGKAAKAEHGTSLLTAFQQIRELIVHGKLAPGTWIVEGDLADRLGMSRTPVRGALHWLQREGYVLEQKSASKTRMFVAPLTKDDARELYAIIGRMEGMAGRETARLPEADRKEIAKTLREINQQLHDIVKDGRPSAAGGIFDLDRQFHRTIVVSSAGPRLTVLHNAIEPQAERYWRLYASSIINDLHISLEEHEEIIRAIEAGDANRVEKALMANWANGCERLEQVIEMFGERGSW
ncbi:GntR family transcriptional regulator [Silvibacterium sp.]|uniref:GntR family transcriptional regulator n=1 Tax=Silvibacterium sp. TaxID=1964179 RepID=UPI0039E24ABD